MTLKKHETSNMLKPQSTITTPERYHWLYQEQKNLTLKYKNRFDNWNREYQWIRNMLLQNHRNCLKQINTK